MRTQFCDAMLAEADRSGDLLFLTGDLGFMALEPLQQKLGERFINCGVAEQNMMTVAAALAAQDFGVWAYSIAPFCYARPFEQVRNDIAFHNLPVHLVGNGGGYGYGVMGPTHHAIEDYGVLLTLPNFRVYIPAFDEDVAAIVARVAQASVPTYLRLGRGEPPKGFAVPEYAPWRQLTQGSGGVVVAVGPLAGTYIGPFLELPYAERPNLWITAELPVSASPPPAELLAQIAVATRLCVAEEHVAQGGLASQLTLHLAGAGLRIPEFRHLYAKAHIYDRYGSQKYMRTQAALDISDIAAALS
jgi:transketolase